MAKGRFILFVLCFLGQLVFAQRIDFTSDPDKNLFIRLYAQMEYQHQIVNGQRSIGTFDARRIVPVIGYQFNKKLQFVTEIEFEHANEIYIEQAFIKQQLKPNLSLRAGMILIPMGMVNEDHEPTAFFGNRRPLIDRYIIPTTWREIGAGISGLITEADLKYQLYIVNGLLSYSDRPLYNAYSGLRPGRQKGIKSLLSGLPGITGKLEYYGWPQLRWGVSMYHGNSQSELYKGLDSTDLEATARADSSVLRMTQAALFLRHNAGRFTSKAQLVFTHLGNIEEYNALAGEMMGRFMYGYYIEGSYALLVKGTHTLTAFARYSQYDTQVGTTSEMTDLATKKDILTCGLDYKPHPGVVYKLDYQFVKGTGGVATRHYVTTGFGVWF